MMKLQKPTQTSELIEAFGFIKAPKQNKCQKGFNLVEISLVLVIVGLLSAGGFQMMKVQRDAAKFSSSEQSLQQVKQALLAFAVVNHYLPCPDTDATPDGKENRNGARCTASTGRVPYLDLGLAANNVKDGWNYFMRYAVNQEASTNNICAQSSTPPAGRAANYFCNTPTAPKTTLPQFDLKTLPTQNAPSTGDYAVCSASAVNCTLASTMAADQQSVVLVAFNKDGGVTNCNSLGAQEKENCNTNNLYWAAQPNETASGYFDDMIVTLSGYDIKKAFLENNPTALNTNLPNNTQGNQPLGNLPLGNLPLGNLPLGNLPLGNQQQGNQQQGNH